METIELCFCVIILLISWANYSFWPLSLGKLIKKTLRTFKSKILTWKIPFRATWIFIVRKSMFKLCKTLHFVNTQSVKINCHCCLTDCSEVGRRQPSSIHFKWSIVMCMCAIGESRQVERMTCGGKSTLFVYWHSVENGLPSSHRNILKANFVIPLRRWLCTTKSKDNSHETVRSWPDVFYKAQAHSLSQFLCPPAPIKEWTKCMHIYLCERECQVRVAAL